MPPFPRLLDSLGSSDKSYERKIKIIMLQSQLQSIVEKFAVSATVSTIRPLGSGLINDTYLVVTEEKDQPDYVLQRINHEGKLPKRVCHCDTKVNNMLFSEDGSEVLCVIDLDTVMPSFIFSDYGDFLRTAASTAAEDEPDFSKIQFRQDVFQAFTKGYLASARSFLTPLEIQMLPYAVVLFPYMQSVRFLWDYLNGDGYWKVQYPTHNLVRAQNQFELVKRVEEAMPAIKAFINFQLN